MTIMGARDTKKKKKKKLYVKIKILKIVKLQPYNYEQKEKHPRIQTR